MKSIFGQQCFLCVYYHLLHRAQFDVCCVAVKGWPILLRSTSSFQIHRVYTQKSVAASSAALKEWKNHLKYNVAVKGFYSP